MGPVATSWVQRWTDVGPTIGSLGRPLSDHAGSATCRVDSGVVGRDRCAIAPRSAHPAQRKAQVRVPRQAKSYRGAKRETKAVYRTRSGALAVPASFAIGHQFTKGQAVTLDEGACGQRSF